VGVQVGWDWLGPVRAEEQEAEEQRDMSPVQMLSLSGIKRLMQQTHLQELNVAKLEVWECGIQLLVVYGNVLQERRDASWLGSVRRCCVTVGLQAAPKHQIWNVRPASMP